MTGLPARNSARLALVAGALAPALLALSLTPTIAGGPFFAPYNGINNGIPNAGHGSFGGWGGEACNLGIAGAAACTEFAPFANPQAVGAFQAPPGAKLTSFDVATVDSIMGRYFLADQGNNGIQMLNTRGADWQFGMFNQPHYQATLCQGKFRGTGRFRTGQNGINQTYNMGPNGLVVVNHRAVWAGDGDSTIKVCSLGGQLLATISTGGTARVGKGCFDPVHQTVLFVNDLERNFDTQKSSQSVYPFFTIFKAATYAPIAKHTLNPAYMDPKTPAITFAYIANYYPAPLPTGIALHTAASAGVGGVHL